MEKVLKRISVMVREDQYDRVVKEGLNLSGLIRDLLDDHFGQNRIVLSVNEETRKLYAQIVSNTGTTDAEVEPFMRAALHSLLQEKIKELQKLQGNVLVKPTRAGSR